MLIIGVRWRSLCVAQTSRSRMVSEWEHLARTPKTITTYLGLLYTKLNICVGFRYAQPNLQKIMILHLI
jgi:hypothetical protein